MSDMILETRSLSRYFGALPAADEVTLNIARGQLHVLIGPNGAGKSTLLNLLSGELTPSSGQVLFEGRDITRLNPPKRAQLGIGRSFQKTNVFGHFTCRENAWLGAEAKTPLRLNRFNPFSRSQKSYDAADHALDLCHLTRRAEDLASDLSHGERRQLEIAMMLAGKPDLLLLDEPLAGLGPEEARQITALLKDLSQHHTVVLVEHDMDAVFQLADVITVLVNGRVLESGSPEQIKGSAAVREAYLGEDA